MNHVRQDSVGDGETCLSGSKQLCEEHPLAALPGAVWIGTAPDCRAQESDCQRHGMEYITRSKSGDGALCLGAGYKVLCAMPETPPKPEVADNADSFNVLSFNVFMRPYIIAHDGQAERSCQVARAISELEIERGIRLDAIAFSEAFMAGCVDGMDFRQTLEDHGWPHATSPETGYASGIFIASRWPIVDQAESVFADAVLPDSLAPKGVHHARIAKNVDGRTVYYNLFATHFQAWVSGALNTSIGGDHGAGIRARQAAQMAAFIKARATSRSEAVIVAGDFNVERGTGEFSEVVRILGAKVIDDAFIEGKGTYFKNLLGPEGWTHETKGASWLDYVMAIEGYRESAASRMSVVEMRGAEPFSICMGSLVPISVAPDSVDCRANETITSLSDHAAVLGEFTFK